MPLALKRNCLPPNRPLRARRQAKLRSQTWFGWAEPCAIPLDDKQNLRPNASYYLQNRQNLPQRRPGLRTPGLAAATWRQLCRSVARCRRLSYCATSVRQSCERIETFGPATYLWTVIQENSCWFLLAGSGSGKATPSASA